ncbi:MAG: hypothetical protein IJ489_01875 [Clostridia bacterium]|nr:hypothetical protein [Clostridia bacterium]
MGFKEFWQRYKGEIGKLLVTHIALAVFSIMCTAPLLVTNTEENASSINTIVIIASVFVFAFYYYLIRSQLWTLGAKNSISAKGGRMKLCPLAGLYMGLIASIPSFILNAVYIISSFYGDYEGVSNVFATTAFLEALWNAPALGLRIATGSPFAYLASSVLPALFAGIAYFCGTKEFALFGVPQKNR